MSASFVSVWLTSSKMTLICTKSKSACCYQLLRTELLPSLKNWPANKHLSMWQIYILQNFKNSPHFLSNNIKTYKFFPKQRMFSFLNFFTKLYIFKKKKCKEALHIHMTLTRVDDILKGKLIYVWYSTNFSFFNKKFLIKKKLT